MCSPSLAVSGVGLALQVSAQEKQAKAEEEAADERADILRNNARLANLAADEEIKIGKQDRRNFEQDLKQFSGTQVAAMGASGADIGSGSFLDIVGDTARFGAVDSLTIRSNSRRKANSIRNQTTIFEAQANTATRIGRQRASALRLGATGTLLTGGVSLYNRSQAS